MILIYEALLTQTDDNNPTVEIFQNSLGNIDWTRNGAGDYFGTKAGFFDENKTALNCKAFATSGFISDFFVDSIDRVNLQTKQEFGGVLCDNVLYKHYIVIKVKTD